MPKCAARCVTKGLALAAYDEGQAAGGQFKYEYSGGEWTATLGISAVYRAAKRL